MSGGLTKRQHEALLFLREYIARHGTSPTFEEIQNHLGLASKSGIKRIIVGLEERGFIHQLPNRARAIRVIGEADGVSFSDHFEFNERVLIRKAAEQSGRSVDEFCRRAIMDSVRSTVGRG